ncbi:NAD(P)/FAD-dependent oxidoreductase [Mycobacterium sp. 155]|uniref:flavin monoamine oxidase family protein n=1 Tax=Mycobacterium sp. 155 TaxID=1157943 RepID=UPI0003630D38|nr:NAD(P)/FAD-dependent oxidoreductase [Mycobacterium sp. 155]
MAQDDIDVVVIGAGFAGLAAARELGWLGLRVTTVEARNRIGGRTHTEQRWGIRLEMGGAYVHWHQPHVWAELSRYGLGVVVAGAADASLAYWYADGALHSGTVGEFNELAAQRIRDLMQSARDYLPHPYRPLAGIRVGDVDKLAVPEYLDRLELSAVERDLVDALIATDSSGQPGEVAMSQTFRWWVFANGDWDQHFDMTGGFKIAEGTSALAARMAADARGEIRLTTQVTAIEQQANRVIVTLDNGEQLNAAAAIVTVPLSTLQRIDFTPPLSDGKRAMITEGQMARGTKVWARLRGDYEPFLAIAPPRFPLTAAQVEGHVHGDTIVVGFGPDAEAFDPCDRAAVEQALRLWIPDADVVDSFGHNWVADEFAGETWPMLRPGQLTHHFADLRRPHGRVYFAGSIYARGWGSFIDGALESGIEQARAIAEIIQPGV